MIMIKCLFKMNLDIIHENIKNKATNTLEYQRSIDYSCVLHVV